MLEIAPDLHQVPLFPRSGVNAYLVGDVLVDAGVAQSSKKLLREIAGRPIRAHAITHAHADHVGGSANVLRALNVPFWCPAGDAPAARAGAAVTKAGPLKRVLDSVGRFQRVAVERELRAGDELAAGFVVVETPGHSPGHASYWRESDRVLVLGDVLANMNLFTTAVGLHWLPGPVTVDPPRNRASAEAVVALEPEVVVFGHGPVLRQATPAIRAFLEQH